MKMYQNIVFIKILTCILYVTAGPAAKNNFKDQYCIDPRTMEKHEVYQEWADAYSCTRHRCQPGGRNLAIYTVGCKRVEAPESAIECEEVVEDTNMQFPYCCTRLRCLVVVRGEVWTKVLGQPWESLPAAPWSHMYKMKKPPPMNNLPKNAIQGPVYEIQTDIEDKSDKVLRTSKKTTEAPDCNDVVPRVAAAPDIVIALATSNDEKERAQIDALRHKRPRKTTSSPFQEDSDRDGNQDLEETAEKIHEASEEKYDVHELGVTQKSPSEKRLQWTAVPQNQWNEPEGEADTNGHIDLEKPEKQSGLQALVDAIGNRMRDIESVVQKMSEKVQHKVDPVSSLETRAHSDTETLKHRKQDSEPGKAKKPNADKDYKRFSVRNRSRYLATTEVPVDQPLFVEDSNGYFSDASNSVIRRANPPKEPATYMAPVETRRKHPDIPDDVEKRRRKHAHKKKHGKGKGHKKHHQGKEEKRKHFNRLNSNEVDKNVASAEDSGAVK